MSEPTANDRFYNELTPFHNFAAFVEFGAYESVPDDWVVMISDVQGSTRGLALEARATVGGGTFLWRYVEVLVSSLIQLWCERFDRQAGSYNAPVYRDELRSNTDFCKYDGILCMVLDVSEDQAALIEAYLEDEQNARRLVHGVHVTDTALMTCLIFSLEQSKHVHFIDGSDGGFAMAAKAFKSRLTAV